MKAKGKENSLTLYNLRANTRDEATKTTLGKYNLYEAGFELPLPLMVNNKEER